MLPISARRVIDAALQEDLGLGDVTSSALVASHRQLRAAAVAREALVACGVEVAAEVFWRVDRDLEVAMAANDGERVAPGGTLLRVEGAARALLGAERVVLNLLQHLSGVATTTRAYVDAVAEYPTRVCDTRKTTPGLRELEKMAVRCGGGHNHRAALGDCVMVKDNHIAVCGSVSAAVAAARKHAPHTATIEVEADNPSQATEAADAGASIVLLDNMTPAAVGEAVTQLGGRVTVEVSGGVTIETAADYARAGADVISIGALTHSRRWVDIGLDYVG